jgi:hypothetical protein
MGVMSPPNNRLVRTRYAVRTSATFCQKNMKTKQRTILLAAILGTIFPCMAQV